MQLQKSKYLLNFATKLEKKADKVILNQYFYILQLFTLLNFKQYDKQTK